MTTLVEKIYLAAANVGFLKTCDWQPSNGSAIQTHAVGVSAPDQDVLSGLGVSTEYEMTYPNSCLWGSKPARWCKLRAWSIRCEKSWPWATGPRCGPN